MSADDGEPLTIQVRDCDRPLVDGLTPMPTYQHHVLDTALSLGIDLLVQGYARSRGMSYTDAVDALRARGTRSRRRAAP
jgi:hypothetical protein